MTDQSNIFDKIAIWSFGIVAIYFLASPRIDFLNQVTTPSEPVVSVSSETLDDTSKTEDDQNIPDTANNSPEPTPNMEEEPSPETTVSEQTDTVSEPEDFAPPYAELIRFDGENAIIAGTAAAGASIFITNDDQPVAEGMAGSDGQFALSFGFAIPADGALLSLSAIQPDGSRAEAAQLIPVFARDDGQTLTASVTKDEVKVNTAPIAAGKVELSETRYGADGPVSLHGQSDADVWIELSLDNKSIGRTQSDEDGKWSIDDVKMDVGMHQLAMTLEGQDPVLVQIERAAITTNTQNTNTEPEIVSAAIEPIKQAIEVTDQNENKQTEDDDREPVNPDWDLANEPSVEILDGDTLWRIAERKYGSGIRYIDIYKNNAAKIGDPNLIYPGQQFEFD